MFGWFKKKTDEDRGIFSFWDGTVGYSHRKPNRKTDPMPLYDKVYAKRKEIIIDFKALDFPDTQFAPEARTRLTKTVREIFGVRPLINGIDIPPEGTLKDSEVLALLDDFLIYTEAVKKNLTQALTPSPISSPSTGEPLVGVNGSPST